MLIVDSNNSVVIAIENKIDADESKGQLEKYEKIVEKKYKSYKSSYYIFLTRSLDEPSSDKWAKASHQMVADVIENVLKTKDVDIKTKIILESYVDLLERNGIIESKNLESLCAGLWKDHKKVLEVIANYRPSKLKDLADIINECENIELCENKEKAFNGAYSFYVKEADHNSHYILKIWYSTGQKKINCRIVTKEEKLLVDLRKIIVINGRFSVANDSQFGYHNLTLNIPEWTLSEEEISKEKICSIVEDFKKHNKKFMSTKEVESE